MLPFGAPMFCALLGFTLNRPLTDSDVRADGIAVGFICAVYVLCPYLFTFDVWRLYVCGTSVLIMTLRWFLAFKLPALDRTSVRYVFSALSIVMESALIGVFSNPIKAVISGTVGLIFLYVARLAAICAMQRFAFRLSAPEAAAVCIVMAVAGLTFGRAVYRGVDIGLAFAFFALYVLCVIGAKATLAGGISIAIGLGLNDVALSLAFTASVAVSAAFCSLPRPMYTVLGIGVFAAFGVLLGAYPVTVGFDCIAAAVGAAVFMVFPRRAVRALREYFDFDVSSRIAVRHYINRVKADAGNRMLILASVFDESARLMNAFGDPPPDYAAAGAALCDRICPYCEIASKCDMAAAAAAFTAIAERAHSGKAVLTELPEFFTSECKKTAEVLSAAGKIAESARERIKRNESDTKARAIVTERLAAVKDVLAELGSSEAAPVGFDGEAERAIAAELAASGTECASAFVTREGVTAIVRSAGADRNRMKKAVSAVLKKNYEITEFAPTQASGWSVATFKKSPTYEAVYARAGVSKSGGVSGDSYTFRRIGDKFLVALLDGMGTGERAGAGSDAAIELIESFYRAGFDSQAALSGVNRFLKMPGGESFSAADVAVCDLDSAAVDIIKIGAPPCYIKTADTVLKIEGSSLPIGVLDEMKPFVTAKRLYAGQMLIFVTDGVSDCFGGDELPEFINELAPLNPARTADRILRRALKLCGDTPKDDMTVIAFRLYEVKSQRRAVKRQAINADVRELAECAR